MEDYTGHDIYCDLILSKKIEVELLKETTNVLAFNHTKPSFETHIIVIPKQHIASLVALTDTNLQTEILEVIKELSNKVLTEMGEARVITNMGNFQESKHLHFHIIAGKKLIK